ncbi:small RNA 2'-O-methyltransferase-like [Ylistrum balloti]|uniref:small RNA 2'-O-methyltransferase-like n=1 Tax=Ylistrum balloti TaxID=509963 RepID=UPI002905BD8B|nr:small RNA 2'-O-methyltransferase-like [Ylistrum balloti]
MGSILNSLWNTIKLETYKHQKINADFGGDGSTKDHFGSSVDGEQFLNVDKEYDKLLTDIDFNGYNPTPAAKRYQSMVDNCQKMQQNVCLTDVESQVESTKDMVKSTMCEDENRLGGPMFDPPLYVQRYSFLADKLNSLNVHSVVDFGCAECQLSRYLADIASVQRIALVDMNRPLLQTHKYNIKPAIYHFLDKRNHLLTIQIYHGDATVVDMRMLGYDAVSMIEFIEHLCPEDLHKVCNTVFHELQPRIIVVTTPNFEYNQLFPDDGQTFRHCDHKFEWTRKEFQSWGNLQAGIHGYTVHYTGIGDPPQEKSHLGHCSQAAIFEKIEIKQRTPVNKFHSHCYTLIAEEVYPYMNKEDTMSPSEALSMEIQYNIRELLKGENYLELEPDKVVIYLSELMKYKKLAKMCKSNIISLREHFVDKNFVLTKDLSGIIVCPTDYFETKTFDQDDDNEDWDLDELDGNTKEKEVMTSRNHIVIDSMPPEECWD